MRKFLFLMSLLLITAQGGKQTIEKQAFSTNLPSISVKPLAQSQIDCELSPMPEALSPWESMEAPVTALVMSLIEKDLSYDPQDEDFFWSSLYYMLGIYQSMDFRVIDQGNSFLMPEEMVQDCAFALFGTMPQPDLPENSFLSYHKESNTYSLEKGDASLSYCLLDNTSYLENGQITFHGRYIDYATEEVTCHFQATVTQGEGLFGYHLSHMSISQWKLS
ncbi:MAG: hypothetical protein R3Y63_04090 [Eubacteriales bacterium]